MHFNTLVNSKIPQFCILLIGIILGIIETFFGQKLFKFTIFLLGFMGAFIPSLLFLFGLFGSGATWENWIMLCLSVIVGVCLGSFVVYVEKFGFLVAGAVLGDDWGEALVERMEGGSDSEEGSDDEDGSDDDDSEKKKKKDGDSGSGDDKKKKKFFGRSKKD